MRDFWRSHDGLLGEFATRFAGSSDLYGDAGRRPDRVGQPDHRARRLHPAPTWSPTTPSTTRPTARTTGTAPTTTGPGTAAPRGPPTTPSILRPARPPAAAPCSPPCCCRSASRCCSAATSWAAPSRATTTPTARTTRSPGSTGPASTTDLLDVHPAADRVPAGASGVPPPPVPGRRRRAAELRWFTPAGTPMTAGDWADPSARGVAIYLDGPTRPTGPPTAARCSTTTSWCWSTPGGSRWTSCCRRSARASTGWRRSTRSSRRPSRPHGKRHAGDRVAAGPRSIVVLRGTAETGQAP